MPIIDQHDDLAESFLAACDPESVSEILKESSWRESADLLDRDFALIIVDSQGKEHRKFACFDPGNSLMSEWYLLYADHGLPEEAVKTAAANIADSLEGFGLVPTKATTYLASEPEGDSRRVFVKQANTTPASYTASVGGSTTSMSPGMMGGMGGTAGALAGARSGGSPMARLGKAAVGGIMGGGAAAGAAKAFNTGAKLASAFDLVAEATAQWDDLDPYDRHDIAVDLVKEASLVGAAVPNHIFQYSGTTLNPHFDKIAEARTNFTRDLNVSDGYLRLAKMAAAMDPEDVVEAMYLLDEQAQINHRYGSRIPDPVLSVFGTTKEAEYSWTLGGDHVNESMLMRYAGSDAVQKLDDVFSEDFTDIFKKDPLGTFKRLPEEQQILVARMASQSRDTNNGGY